MYVGLTKVYDACIIYIKCIYCIVLHYVIRKIVTYYRIGIVINEYKFICIYLFINVPLSNSWPAKLAYEAIYNMTADYSVRWFD